MAKQAKPFTLGRDTNGNKVLKFRNAHGSFSVQTLGNLPAVHRMEKGRIDADVAMAELSAYIERHGTARQKNILAGRVATPSRLQKMGAGMKERHSGYADNPASREEKEKEFDLARQHLYVWRAKQAEWSKVFNDAFRAAFGRAPEYGEINVSGIGNAGISYDAKAKLRKINEQINNALDLAHAHYKRSGKRSWSTFKEQDTPSMKRAGLGRAKNPDAIHIDVNSHNTKGKNVRAKNPSKVVQRAYNLYAGSRKLDRVFYRAGGNKVQREAEVFRMEANNYPGLTKVVEDATSHRVHAANVARGHQHARMSNPGDNYADESAEARELFLFATNDAGLYKRNIIPAIENLAKKMAKGQYDSVKAAKLFEYTANFAADEYAKQHGARGQKGHEIFKPADRRIVAREFVDYYAEDIASRAQEIAAKPRRKNPATIGTKARNPHNVILRAYHRDTGKSGYWTGEAWDTEKRKARKIGALAGIQGAMTIARKLADAMPDGWHIEVLEA